MRKNMKAVVVAALAALLTAPTLPVSAATYQGVDIAHYAYSVDFNALKASGHGQFVYIKTSEGITWRDPKWQQFTSGAKAAGIPYGYYHYFHSNDSGVTQAEVFWGLIKDTGYTVIPAVDVEETDGNDAPVIQRELRAFVDEFYALSGKKPVIYASTYFINKFIGSGFTDCKLWQADYRGSAASVSGWGNGYTIWQYSGSSKVDGVDNSADLDIAADEDIFVDGKAAGESPASEPAAQPSTPRLAHHVGETVTFSTCYSSSTDPIGEAIPASRMSVHTGKITKILAGRHNPYLLDNGLCWVNDGDIRSSDAESIASQSTEISVGNTVAIRSGAEYGGVSVDRGKSVPKWVISGSYRVERISTHNGVREALLSGIDSWIATSKLYRR